MQSTQPTSFNHLKNTKSQNIGGIKMKNEAIQKQKEMIKAKFVKQLAALAVKEKAAAARAKVLQRKAAEKNKILLAAIVLRHHTGEKFDDIEGMVSELSAILAPVTSDAKKQATKAAVSTGNATSSTTDVVTLSS